MARVIVVGAGVVGLSCAVRLLEAGHRVDVVARDLPLETTSAVAAALWYPYRAYPFDRVTAWSRGRLRRAGDPRGARRHRRADAAPAPSCTAARTGRPVVARRRAGADPGERAAGRRTPTAGRFVAPVVEMPVYLRWLAARVEALGGTLTRMALAALPDRAEVVVNATGLGARLMADDPS